MVDKLTVFTLLSENSISNGFIYNQESLNSDTPSSEHSNHNQSQAKAMPMVIGRA